MKWYCKVCGALVTEGWFSTSCPGCKLDKAGSLPRNGTYAEAAAGRANVTCKLIIDQGDNPNIPLGGAPNTENGICAAIVSEWLRLYHGRLNTRDTCLAEFAAACGPELADDLAAKQSVLASKNQTTRLMHQQNQMVLLQMGPLQQQALQIAQQAQVGVLNLTGDQIDGLKQQMAALKLQMAPLKTQIDANTLNYNRAQAQELRSKTGGIPNIVKTTHAHNQQGNLFTTLTGQAGYYTIGICKADGTAAHALGLIVGNGRALFLDPNTALFSDSHPARIKLLMDDHMANVYAAYDGVFTVYKGL